MASIKKIGPVSQILIAFILATSLGFVSDSAIAQKRCVWVRGHWFHGHWVPAHKVCWRHKHRRHHHGCVWRHGHRVCW